jgi:hypothetical protein
MFAKLHLLSQDQPEAGRAGDTSATPYGDLTVTFQPRQHRVEVDGELQLEVVGADHRHRPQRSPSSAWATSSTRAAVERQDREYGVRRAPRLLCRV